MGVMTPLQTALFNGFWETWKYIPTPEQKEFHDHPARIKVIGGGVGAGKSFSTAMELAKYAGIPNGKGWIIANNYDLAAPEFDYLLQGFREMGVVDELTVAESAVRAKRFKLIPEVGGFEFSTKSAQNQEAIAAYRPDFVALVEAAQAPFTILTKIIERTTEKNAPIIFNGTFESGGSWYAELFDKWREDNEDNARSFSIPTWTNRTLYPGGYDDPKLAEARRNMPPELFMERYGGVPSKPSGLVFKDFDRFSHTAPREALFDPDQPVELWVDPAYHCYAVLFVQIQKDNLTVHVLDEVYRRNMLGQEIVQEVIAHPYWRHSCETGVIDVAGRRRMGANASQVEVWQTELMRNGEHQIRWESRDIRDVALWYNAIHLRLRNKNINGTPLLMFAREMNDTVNADGTANGVLGEIKTHRYPKVYEHTSHPTRPIKFNEDALSAVGYGLFARFGPTESKEQNVRFKPFIKPYYTGRSQARGGIIQPYGSNTRRG